MADIKGMLKLDAILKLSRSKKITILVVLNIVIAGLLFQFLIKPAMASIGGLEGQLMELRGQIDENRRIASDIPRFQAEKEELEKRLNEAVAQLPNEKEIPNLIDSISKAGNESGLTVSLFEPRPEVSKGFYAEVPVSMDVSGTYASLFDFCDQVSKLSRIVNITGIKVSSGGQKAINELSPELSASFVATTFRFIPESAPDAPGGNK